MAEPVLPAVDEWLGVHYTRTEVAVYVYRVTDWWDERQALRERGSLRTAVLGAMWIGESREEFQCDSHNWGNPGKEAEGCLADCLRYPCSVCVRECRTLHRSSMCMSLSWTLFSVQKTSRNTGQFTSDMTKLGLFFVERSIQIFYCFAS